MLVRDEDRSSSSSEEELDKGLRYNECLSSLIKDV
jgi:hypothetical protein